MKVTRTAWFGTEPVEFTDAAGNRYDTQSHTITLKDGSTTKLNQDDHVNLTNALNGIIARDQGMVEKWLMLGFVGDLMRQNMYPDAPENIIELVTTAKRAGKNWDHHLKYPLVESLDNFTNTHLRHTPEGAECVSSTMLGFEPSLVEFPRALLGNPTRFACTDGSTIDTLEEPNRLLPKGQKPDSVISKT